MIVAIEGFIPDRRLSPAQTQPAAPPAQPQIYPSAWRRRQQQQAEGVEPGDAVIAVEPQPAAPQAHEPQPRPSPANEAASRNPGANHASHLNPFIQPETLSRLPDATGYTFDAVVNTNSSLRLPMSLKKGPFTRGR
jgi:hypothetical protein